MIKGIQATIYWRVATLTDLQGQKEWYVLTVKLLMQIDGINANGGDSHGYGSQGLAIP